jgi:hypothetical protein
VASNEIKKWKVKLFFKELNSNSRQVLVFHHVWVLTSLFILLQQNNCISITPTWLTHSNLETPFGNNQEGAGEWVPIPIHHFLILNIRPNILDQLYNILFVERFVM